MLIPLSGKNSEIRRSTDLPDVTRTRQGTGFEQWNQHADDISRRIVQIFEQNPVAIDGRLGETSSLPDKLTWNVGASITTKQGLQSS